MPRVPGEPAPTVTASNQDGESVTLAFAEPTVLYFYPEDGTPGCTTEAEQFQLELDTYREAGVDVYGVSTDTVASHREFAAARGVGFDLLADPDGEVTDRYSGTEETSHGLTGIAGTYVVDEDGTVRYEQVADHPADRIYGNWVRHYVRNGYEDPF